MVDPASIIIAVISAVVSLASVGFTGYLSYYQDQEKQKKEAKSLTDKYRDPLTQCAYDLQSRFFGLVDGKLLDYIDDPSRADNVRLYTAFLVGQYFSWVYIFRRQAQFLRFSEDATNKKLNMIVDRVANDFATHRSDEGDAFMFWRGQQTAMGEVMTQVEEGGQLYCMGFAAFCKKYQSKEEEDVENFQKWFKPVEDGIQELAAARKEKRKPVANRLRRLQHLLIDLVGLIGGTQFNHGLYPKSKGSAATPCECEEHGCVLAKRKQENGV